MIVAAIDIGTNSILLLVAEKQQGILSPLTDLAKTVRLGEGLSETGILNESAMTRALNGLEVYQKQLQFFSPEQVICFGTAALRMAQNASVFCNQVKQQFGWKVQTLSGEAEALYTFRGALSSLAASQPSGSQDAVAIDIGGGSTEVICGTPDKIHSQYSIPMGAVVAKEQFQLGEQISSAQQTEVKQSLNESFATLTMPLHQPTILVTGGTATTLAALDQQLTTYDIQRIDGHQMSRIEIATLYDTLNAMTLSDRSQLPGMEPGRADIILPALLILLTLLEKLQIENIQITVRGARYGILL